VNAGPLSGPPRSCYWNRVRDRLLAKRRGGAAGDDTVSKSLVLLVPIRFITIAWLCLVVACGGQGPEDLPRVAAPSRPDTLAAEPVPATLEQALNALDRGLSGGAFQAMQVLSEDDAVAFFYSTHHGGGVLWQSPWNLTFDGPLQRELSLNGFRHPDDMSEAVLRSFWRRLHKRPIELAGQAREANTVRDAARIAPHWVMFSEQSAVSLAHQCSRQAPLPDSAWTPDAAVIRQLEAALPAALQDALNRKTPANSVRLDASDYYRQYGGLVTGGRRIVYVNGFHRKALDLLAEFPKGAMSWQTSPVVVCDGGWWYFGAEYDPSTRRAGLVTFN
jgi:hypothetical protein